MFWYAFLVSVAFWPGTLDPATNVRWAIMAVLGGFFLLARGGAAPLKGVGLAAVVTAAASLSWTPDLLSGMDDFIHLLVLATVFCVGATFDDLDSAWKGLAAGVSISLPLAIAQRFGYTGIEQVLVAAPGGLFMNRNFLSEAALVASVGAFCVGSWLWIPAALTLLVGGSKAALAAGAVAAALIVWNRGDRRSAFTILGIVCIAAGWVFASGNASADVRLGIWRETVAGFTWLGHGLGSYEVDFPYYLEAHSEPLQIIYDLGLFAVLPAVIVLHLLRGPINAERLVFICVLAVACFSFPLRLPVTAFACALAAGCLARRASRVRLLKPHGRVAYPHLSGHRDTTQGIHAAQV